MSFRTAYDGLWWLIEASLVVLAATMLLAVFLQVIFRYVLQIPLSWSEELARYMFAWVVMLGSAVAVRRNAHFALRLLSERLGPRPELVCILLVNATVLVLLVVMIWQGSLWVINYSDMVSPAMQIRLSYVVAAVPVACLMMSIEVVLQSFQVVRHAKPRPGSSGGSETE